ncbi:MAG: hypothetical protein OSB57_06750 [Planctomycetota bacterium]|nr:hypothetical protein [Planctomycetota bacterium]
MLNPALPPYMAVFKEMVESTLNGQGLRRATEGGIEQGANREAGSRNTEGVLRAWGTSEDFNGSR